jgi:sugar phosphate isomerase/epimerase
MRWNKDALPTDQYLKLMATNLRAQKAMLRDLGIILAIETHFEFTSFELLRLFDMCGAAPGEYLGICLDTANLLTMLENPVSATERLLPWVVTTHIKDAGLLLRPQGLVSFTAEAGTGVIDLKTIFERLSALPGKINLSLEDHGGEVLIPVHDAAFLALFPDLTVQEFVSLMALAAKSQELHDKRKLDVLDRARWPEVCERRVRHGLKAIRRLIEAKEE